MAVSGFSLLILALVVLVLFYLFTGIKTVSQGYNYTVERFGRYTKTLTDPVSFERFHPKRTSPHVAFRGRDYYFAADSTLARFQAEPEKWFERKMSH